MELITSLSDTLPAWLGGIGGILAAFLAGYALVRAIRAEARHVVWQISNERNENGRTEKWRLVNTTEGVAARVLGFENISDGLQDAVRGKAELPAYVAPGLWYPFSHERSMASPYPTIVRVTWRESPSQGRRFRRRKYTSVLYID
ncbi:hypothetical protein [Leucobacter chironomi]|uniref:hypothetical protein n=1 Tax=Leucobacter chironomi TaxID=491918 RepID=UPI001267EC5C|nr:hypothetical protein [Leucobacter chironomi]